MFLFCKKLEREGGQKHGCTKFTFAVVGGGGKKFALLAKMGK